MRIANKLGLAIVLVFVASAVANHVVMESTIKPRFEDFERDSARRAHQQVLDTLRAQSAKSMTTAQDYGHWDDAYDFLRGRNGKSFKRANLSPPLSVLESLGINVLVFRRPDGRVMWAEAFDLNAQKPIEGLAAEVAALAYHHPYLTGGADPMATSGFLRSKHGMLVAAIAPIIKTDRSGKPVGELIAANLLDEAAIKAQTGFEYALQPLQTGEIVDSAKPQIRTQPQHIETVSMVADLAGRPLAALTVRTPRDISKAGRMAIHSATMIMLAAALAVVASLLLFVRWLVVDRISGLSRHLATAGEAGQISKLPGHQGDDEIGQLARAFNAMADEVNHLRDTLADSSYQQGRAEWASGTLHNVRNGLSPVTTSVWRLKQIFEAPWLANVRTAIAEQQGDASQERKTKLSSYVLANAPKMIAAADQAMAMVRQIESASTEVLDIMTEHEHFARRDIATEAVDLAPLIQSVTASFRAGNPHVADVELPAETAVAIINRTILRQVLANVLINADEAIASTGRPGRIIIRLHKLPNEGLLRIQINDDGEGIAAERLKAIFERGASSRLHRRGGQGLHWSANAMSTFGGSIAASSPGPGKGTTITLTLKSATNIEKEAA